MLTKRLSSLALAVGLAVFGAPAFLSSQQTATLRTMSASRVDGSAPVIDGRLADSAWRRAEIATDFIQREPNTGAPATQRTTVAILYDDGAMYVAMRMFDTQPHLISAPLSRRDDANVPAEWVTVSIDSNLDRRTAFKFATTPRGVQYDALYFEDSREDANWDAVWDVATTIDSLGWTAEFRIPLSQLRYSVDASGNAGPWGVEFGRDVARLSEVSHWAPIKPGTGRLVSFFGTLTGLDGIATPRRLEIMPYTLGRVTRAPGTDANPFFRRNDATASLGADVKYGLTSNLTLTATINPDFGQVEADPSIVNLGSFETFYPERRPFFTEGAEIFRLTMAPELQAFYSRRIGRPPQRVISAPADGFVDAPETARILGAAKVSGRTPGGWSVGLLHAITNESEATLATSVGERVREPVEPLTHYSVARLVRDLRRGQSGVGVIGTSAIRRIEDDQLEFLRSRSFLGGANGWHRFGNNRYEARMLLLGTSVHGSPGSLAATQRSSVHRFNRSDASHLEYDSTMTGMRGWAAEGAIQKIAGDWFGGVNWGVRSPGLELNDAGFHTAADSWYVAPAWSYRTFSPTTHVRNWSTGLTVNPAWTFGGERTRTSIEYRASAQLRNFWGGSFYAARWLGSVSPSDLRGGPALAKAGMSEAEFNVNSNRRRKVSGSLRLYGAYAEEAAERQVVVSPGVLIRPSAAAMISLTPSASFNRDQDQYVRAVTAGGTTRYLMGHLDQVTASLTARVSYTFTPQLSLDVYAQPFLSSGDYRTIREVTDARAGSFGDRFATLGPDRLTFDPAQNSYALQLAPGGSVTSFANPDFSVRQLRANSVLRWQFRPGSSLFLVWSQARDNGILASGFPVRDELDKLFSTPSRNVFLVKASYWIGQ